MEISGLSVFQFCLGQEAFEFKSTLFKRQKYFFSLQEIIYSFHHLIMSLTEPPAENQARPGIAFGWTVRL